MNATEDTNQACYSSKIYVNPRAGILYSESIIAQFIKAQFNNIGNIISSRTSTEGTAAIRFDNGSGILGYVGMNAVDGNLKRINSAGNSSYIIFDSGNYTNYVRRCSLNGSNTANTKGWYLAATCTLTGYSCSNALFVLHDTHSYGSSLWGSFGLFQIQLRCENTSTTIIKDFSWMTRQPKLGYD